MEKQYNLAELLHTVTTGDTTINPTTTTTTTLTLADIEHRQFTRAVMNKVIDTASKTPQIKKIQGSFEQLRKELTQRVVHGEHPDVASMERAQVYVLLWQLLILSADRADEKWKEVSEKYLCDLRETTKGMGEREFKVWCDGLMWQNRSSVVGSSVDALRKERAAVRKESAQESQDGVVDDQEILPETEDTEWTFLDDKKYQSNDSETLAEGSTTTGSTQFFTNVDMDAKVRELETVVQDKSQLLEQTEILLTGEVSKTVSLELEIQDKNQQLRQTKTQLNGESAKIKDLEDLVLDKAHLYEQSQCQYYEEVERTTQLEKAILNKTHMLEKTEIQLDEAMEDRSACEEKAEAKIYKLETMVNEAVSDMNNVREVLYATERTVKEQRQTIAEAQKKLTAYITAAAETQSEVHSMMTKLEASRESRQEVYKKLDMALEENMALQHKQSSLVKQVQELGAAKKNDGDKIEAYEMLHDSLDENYQGLVQKYADLEEEFWDICEEHREFRTKNKSLQEELSKLTATGKKAQRAYDNLDKMYWKTCSELKDVKVKNMECCDRIKTKDAMIARATALLQQPIALAEASNLLIEATEKELQKMMEKNTALREEVEEMEEVKAKLGFFYTMFPSFEGMDAEAMGEYVLEEEEEEDEVEDDNTGDFVLGGDFW